MKDVRLLCIAGWLLLCCAKAVLSSGYFSLGFGIYQVRSQRSGFNGNEPTSNEPEITSPHHDVTGKWELRSSLTGRLPQVRNSANNASANADQGQFPWIHRTVCSNSSSDGPRYRFLLCLDPHDALPDAKPCQLARLETEAVPLMSATPFGRDVIQFGDTRVLGTTPSGDSSSNPVVFGFNEWPGGVRLNVYVTCCGAPPDIASICQETLTFTARAPPLPGYTSRGVAPATMALTGNGGRLMISLLAQCDSDFYGPDCTKQCRVAFPQVEHAYCNQTTGERLCLPGWEGAECQIDTDECRFNYCSKGSTCRNSPPGSFTCQCPDKTYGRLCEFRVPVCPTKPCLNGGSCTDTNYGFICYCTADFTGQRCESTAVVPVVITTPAVIIKTESKVTVRNDTASDIGYVGSVIGNRHLEDSKWQDWHIGLLVCAAVLLISVIVIGCFLIRGRIIKRYKYTKARSFYSMSVKPGTFDNVMYNDDDNVDMVCANDDDSIRRQNPYTSCMDHYPSNNVPDDVDCHPDIVHVHRMAGTGKDSPRLLSAVSSVRRREVMDRDEMGHGYIDLINPYRMSALSDWDSLPELMQPHAVTMLGTRRSTRASQRSKSKMTSSPAVGRHLVMPKMVITQHGDGPPSHSPRAVRLGQAEVYAISGVLTPDSHPVDERPRVPRSKRRKSFINALTARRSPPTEPRLRSIRRVDSCGYEMPRGHPWSVVENEYTSLGRRLPEEHVYDEVHRDESDLDGDGDTLSLQELGVCTAVPPPRDLNPRRMEAKPVPPVKPVRPERPPRKTQGKVRKVALSVDKDNDQANNPRIGRALAENSDNNKGEE